MKIRSILASAALTLAVTAASAQLKSYTFDPAHSEADFTVKHMAISNVHGVFRGVTGKLNFDAANPAKSSVEATIDVNTVDTGIAQRDGHLKSDAFFDVAKFPTMTFKSTSVKKVGDHYDVTGDLTLHGVTKPVVLKLEEPSKPQIGMDKKPHVGFTATTTINRQDYGVKWQAALASGDKAVGDEVKIEIDIDAVQQ